MGRERPDLSTETTGRIRHPLESEQASGERPFSHDEPVMDDIANAPTRIKSEAGQSSVEASSRPMPLSRPRVQRRPHDPSEFVDDAEVMPENRTAAQVADEARWEEMQHLADASSKKRETSGVLPVEMSTAEHLVKELLAEHSVQLSLGEKLLPLGEGKDPFEDEYRDLDEKMKQSTEAKALLEGILSRVHEKQPFTKEETDFLGQEAKKFRRLAQIVEKSAAAEAETARLFPSPKLQESFETNQLFQEQIIRENRERAEALEQLLQEQQEAA